MIIFYDKDTNKIVGTVRGRVHTPEQLAMGMEINGKKAEKCVVPFKPIEKEVEIPIEELRVVDPKTMRVEKVVIGKKKVKKVRGLAPDGSFAQLVYDFEEGKKNPHNFKVKVAKGKLEELIPA